MFRPESASTFAFHVDSLMGFMVAITIFFAVGIAATILFFAIRYRHDSKADRTTSSGSHLWIEIIWTVIPLAIVMFIFAWSSGLFYRMRTPPSNAIEVFVTGKQWMWKTQHPEGARDINALHIPVGVPIKLTMISEDVIHSFYVPAFRTKQDVLPGRYSHTWFEATKPGRYHLFCAEYCGTSHSEMIGSVVVLPRHQFQEWLSGGSASGSMQSAGENLFAKFGCVTCHKPSGDGRGPSLNGVFGKPVQLKSGKTVLADESYLRESILNPSAAQVAGYENVMPAYQNQVDEQGILELIAYIKSLKGQ